jgi:hypothetical protein
MLSSAQEGKKNESFGENINVDEIHSGMSNSVVDCEFNVNESTPLLNSVSKLKHTHIKQGYILY